MPNMLDTTVLIQAKFNASAFFLMEDDEKTLARAQAVRLFGSVDDEEPPELGQDFLIFAGTPVFEGGWVAIIPQSDYEDFSKLLLDGPLAKIFEITIQYLTRTDPNGNGNTAGSMIPLDSASW